MDALDAIVELTKPTSGPNPRIPAGYTYLGQFIDHDITFDPVSKIDQDNDPLALVNFRTPRFDLDPVYGSGPRDQPFLYEWTDRADRGVKLLPNPKRGPRAHLDLPRNQQGLAIIGDARNDENLILSQLHLLFTQFHNRVVEHVRDGASPPTGPDLFAEARQIVSWHYQWIVVHDYLKRIAGPLAERVLRPGADGEPPTVERRCYSWQDEPFIPVEFSGAAFRFGHSMVRNDYFVRPGKPVELFPDLVGFGPLPEALALDWDLFFFDQPDFNEKNNSLRIDGRLSAALLSVPPDGEVLPRLNLRRGRALGLPAGADVARAMKARTLTRHELRLDALPQAIADALFDATPLWWYVMCEAATTDLGAGGAHLGPVGGRIVAEVLVGLLEGDPQSYLRQRPAWRPHLPSKTKGEFTMLDLVAFTTAKTPA